VRPRQAWALLAYESVDKVQFEEVELATLRLGAGRHSSQGTEMHGGKPPDVPEAGSGHDDILIEFGLTARRATVLRGASAIHNRCRFHSGLAVCRSVAESGECQFGQLTETLTDC
jgi:hypothetical protein